MVQHVCDICHQPMTEWRNLLVGVVGTRPCDTQIYRMEADCYRGEFEKEVCPTCFAALDAWMKGAGFTPFPTAVREFFTPAPGIFRPNLYPGATTNQPLENT